MIIDVSCINFAALLCFTTFQVLVSCIGIGILNIECAVLPPASNSAAIPEVSLLLIFSLRANTC